jgi:hypothetical protein
VFRRDTNFPFNLEDGQKNLFIVPNKYNANSINFAVDRLKKENKITKIKLDFYNYNANEEHISNELSQKINRVSQCFF